jgi:hypothetical protein
MIHNWKIRKEANRAVLRPFVKNRFGLRRDVWDGVMLMGLCEEALAYLENWTELLLPSKSIVAKLNSSATSQTPPELC